MAVVAFLTLAFLICKVNSQIFGPGSFLSFPRNFNLESNIPCAAETYGPGPANVLTNFNGPYKTVPNCIQNSVPLSQTTIATAIPCSQPVLNTACIQSSLPSTLIYPSTCDSLSPQPLLNTPSPLFTNIPQLSSSIVTNTVPSCASTPVVTPVIDNTLANSLANALQLLIVSNLIENTLGCGNSLNSNNCGCVNSVSTNCACGNLPSNIPCVNNYEICTADFNAPSCDYPVNIVSYEPVCSYADNIIAVPETICQTPCVDPTLNCGTTFSVIDSNCGFNPCGQSQVVLEIPSQYLKQCSPNVCDIPAVLSVPPMALEVPFPSSIPAQLLCNFGYSSTNQPCVSFNVEPLPCNNFQLCGNYGNFV